MNQFIYNVYLYLLLQDNRELRKNKINIFDVVFKQRYLYIN